MKEITLQENIAKVKINGREYSIDCDDITLHQVISDFVDTYKGNRIASDTFTQDCRRVLDKLLGNGVYNQIFKKDDLKPYYVILQLSEILQENFESRAITNKMRDRERELKQEAESIKSIVEGMQGFNKQMKYAESKYGMKNVVNKRRSTKKYHS